MDTQFSLHWNNYVNQLTDAFSSLLYQEDLVDVTLICEGKKIKAHKMLLSACSPYFLDIFKENPCQHPVIVFRNMRFVDLRAIVDFVYCGEVNVSQGQFESFLSTAEMLEIKGLSDKGDKSEVVETSSIPRTEEENLKVGLRKGLQVKKHIRNKVSVASEISCPSIPPAKKRKSNTENSPDETPVRSVANIILKEEVSDIQMIDEQDTNDSGHEINEPVTNDVSRLVLKSSEHGCDTDTLLNNAGAGEDPSTEKAVDGEIVCSNDDRTVEEEIISQEPFSPGAKAVEPKNSVTFEKGETVYEEGTSLKGEIPVKCNEASSETKHVAVSAGKKNTPGTKEALKGKVYFPKGLVVTPIKVVPKVQGLFDFPAQDTQLSQQEDTCLALRSEDATTPIHEDLNPYSTSDEAPTYEDVSAGQISEGEPEIAEEAPILQTEPTEPEAPVEEERKEQDFDYFGCEICKDEAKLVDLERITFNHKCPICPCACFCTHLLKEHMKVIHGWFNVQRRFTHY